jgi:hypothetical protein
VSERLPWQLVGGARRDRLRAIRELAPSADAAYALRRVLFADPHALVKASNCCRARPSPWNSIP